jgi:UDP-N-acetyl-D-glucosamine dehydrogenase
LIILESTVQPGTTRDFLYPLIIKHSKLSHDDFLLAYSPERIDPLNLKWRLSNTPKVVAGLSKEATKAVSEFYSKFVENLHICDSLEIAELSKLLENTFRYVNISFINELSIFCEKLGVDIIKVISAAATKPYGFMPFYPSAGVGGHCIPVDPTYLAAIAEENGAPETFIRRANEVNLEMSEYIVDRVQADNSGTLQGKSVLVIGIAYKPNVADVRETAAELVIKHLRDRGAVVSWHDEVVGTWHGESSAPLSGADIAVVITKHDVVSEQDILASAPYVFDTTGKVVGAKGL